MPFTDVEVHQYVHFIKTATHDLILHNQVSEENTDSINKSHCAITKLNLSQHCFRHNNCVIDLNMPHYCKLYTITSLVTPRQNDALNKGNKQNYQSAQHVYTKTCGETSTMRIAF